MKKAFPLFSFLAIVLVIIVIASLLYINKNLSPTDNSAAVSNQELLDIGLYDVTAYGADPQGTADSTAAIKQAMALAFKNGKQGDPNRGAVFFPQGTYLVTCLLYTSRCV